MNKAGIWLPIIAFAESPVAAQIARAVLDGAIGYIAWPFDDGELAETIMTALERSQILGETRVREAVARNQIEALTRREREVLSGVASGLSNRKIGQKLGISPRTVEIHRSKMLHKMGVHHTSEAIRIAIEASLLS
jgi:FixJ family two-component response regulator